MTVQEIIDKIDEIDEMVEACESEKDLTFNDYSTIQTLLEEYREDLLGRKVQS